MFMMAFAALWCEIVNLPTYWNN